MMWRTFLAHAARPRMLAHLIIYIVLHFFMLVTAFHALMRVQGLSKLPLLGKTSMMCFDHGSN